MRVATVLLLLLQARLCREVKDAGIAGLISYALWEWGFWVASVPVGVSAYYGVTGHFPDFQNADDQKQLAAEAFAFVTSRGSHFWYND